MLKFKEAALERLEKIEHTLTYVGNNRAKRKLNSEKRFVLHALENQENKSDVYWILAHGLEYRFDKFFSEGFWTSPNLKENLMLIRNELAKDAKLRASMEDAFIDSKGADFTLLAHIVLEEGAAWETVKNNMDGYIAEDTEGSEGYNVFWRKIRMACSNGTNDWSSLLDVIMKPDF